MVFIRFLILRPLGTKKLNFVYSLVGFSVFNLKSLAVDECESTTAKVVELE